MSRKQSNGKTRHHDKPRPPKPWKPPLWLVLRRFRPYR